MALFSFESLTSYLKLRDKSIVADSSYLYRLTDKTDFRHGLILAFHQKVRPINGQFFINVVIRQEFLREIRRVQMIDTMLHLATVDRNLRARYIAKANARNSRNYYKQHLIISGNDPLTAEHLNDCYDDLFKEHLRNGDVQRLISNWKGNVDSSATAQEQAMQMNYISGGGSIPWNSLHKLMQATGMAPTDAMITNFALSIGADAIVTTDLDYMQVASIIDVFMPFSLAKQATGIYDPTND
jgi:predicted nucleic acid-binding protein